ncbi:hypothetical protein P3X46_008491 [Hevea brasiliensis]|uniref:Uncharacterized GPI-anchored protein At5g19230-like domain-containing protein n=1 Tax=Hevea brasiliensis TaxID=3981 RepID=A0ABQ9MMU5_HEVBR|nr:uncharacterized protein LOC110644520 [Hevea brasiliensis]KAJ9180219.1 hypothetical protein P3X46_008491 [Hevea brasiliensis]
MRSAMPMASLKLIRLFLFQLLLAIFLLSSPVLSDGAKDIILQGLNSFRKSMGLPALTINENAACLADVFADQVLEDIPCSSSSPQLQNYPDLLASCDIEVNQTREGAFMPVCVPNLVPHLLLSNYTHASHYVKRLTDAKFTGAGLATEDDWMVLILSTNTPGGNFGSEVDALISHDPMSRGSAGDQQQEVNASDAVDLFKSLNYHRAFLDLPTFVENKETGCLAGELALKLGDQPCNEASRSNPLQLHQFPELLSKCNINMKNNRDGVALPVCVPHLDPTTVFTNYTLTDYAKCINDSNFAEAGLGSKGDWMVVILSTNTAQNATEAGDFALANVLVSTMKEQFAGANSLVSTIGFGHNCLMSFMLRVLVYGGAALAWG